MIGIEFVSELLFHMKSQVGVVWKCMNLSDVGFLCVYFMTISGRFEFGTIQIHKFLSVKPVFVRQYLMLNVVNKSSHAKSLVPSWICFLKRAQSSTYIIHTCDKFQTGMREGFLSFPGGF